MNDRRWDDHIEGELDRMRQLEIGQAIHSKQLRDMEKLMDDFHSSLDRFASAFDSFQKKVFISIVLIFASTAGGQDLLETAGHFFK